MAEDQSVAQAEVEGGEAGEATALEPCLPCHGSGQVISNLGGSAKKLACPWCDGKGVRTSGIDAQAHWIEQRAEEDGSSEGGQDATGDDDEAGPAAGRAAADPPPADS